MEQINSDLAEKIEELLNCQASIKKSKREIQEIEQSVLTRKNEIIRMLFLQQHLDNIKLEEGNNIFQVGDNLFSVECSEGDIINISEVIAQKL